MLYAIQYALGPNKDQRRAVGWTVLCVVVPELKADWKDKDGESHVFQARVSSPTNWKKWASEEVGLFRDYLWKVSNGRIKLRPTVIVARSAVTKLDGKPGNYTLGPSCVKPLLSRYERRQFMSVIVFGPKGGEGCPPGYGSLMSHSTSPQSKRALFIWLPASEERMKTRGRFTKPTGGLPHEFWHSVAYALKYELDLKGRIWIPSNHSKKDFERLKQEIAEQGLPVPENQYEALYGLWPTWRQCHMLAARYGKR